MKLTDRDTEILKEIDRWRFCLGRHIKILADFSSQRACDRRLHSLIKANLLERKRIIYGIPSVYTLTYRAKRLIGANKRKDKFRLDNIAHDIAVLDTAIYFVKKFKLPLKYLLTEKQLHSKDGFSIRNHHPDFIFTKDKKTYCVEIELSLKSKDKLEQNIQSNFYKYDFQIWFVGSNIPKIIKILNNCKKQYQNIKILDIQEVKYVRKIY